MEEANYSTAPNQYDQEISLKNTALWPVTVYVSVMMLIALMGNSFVCYMYGFLLKRTVTRTFIFSLTVLDLTNSLVCFPTDIAILVKFTSFDHTWLCKTANFLRYVLNGSNSTILILIAVDRWYNVCKPCKAFFTRQNVKCTCLGAIAFSLVLSVPSLFLYGTLTFPINGTEEFIMMCMVSDYYIDTWWPLVFYCVHFSIYIVFLVIILTLYLMIILRLRELKIEAIHRSESELRSLRSSGTLPTTLTCPDMDDEDKAKNNKAETRRQAKDSAFKSPKTFIGSREKNVKLARNNHVPLQTPAEGKKSCNPAGKSKVKKKRDGSVGEPRRKELASPRHPTASPCLSLSHISVLASQHGSSSQSADCQSYVQLLSIQNLVSDTAAVEDHQQKGHILLDSALAQKQCVMTDASELTSTNKNTHDSCTNTNVRASTKKISSKFCSSTAVVPRKGESGISKVTKISSEPGLFKSESVQTKAPVRYSKLITERPCLEKAYCNAQATRTFLAVSIAFIISFLPFFCIVLQRSVQGRSFFEMTESEFLASVLLIRFTFISNAVNPIIYSFFNKQVRNECKHLLHNLCSHLICCRRH